MQIKRFEAADMTEALRLVKREFGGDAVILSAKEVRPGGFFSALRKKSVEITAATDYPMDDAQGSDEFSGWLSKHLERDVKTDRVSLSPSPQRSMPASQDARSISQPPSVRDLQRERADRDEPMQRRGLTSAERGFYPKPNITGGPGEASIAERGRTAKSRHLVAKPFYGHITAQKVIALVGACGVGKSTTVAKLAWHCQVVEKKHTGLISLDRFRIGANGMLATVARIMNLPLTIARDAGQLRSALNDLANVDVVLIDTPGMSSTDPSMMEDVCTLLRLADPDETHLVANATARDEVFEATLRLCMPLGVNRLLFTHMDEPSSSTAVSNLLKKGRLPSSFLGAGADPFDGLHETAADGLDGFSPHFGRIGGQVTVLSKKREQSKIHSVAEDANRESEHYIANRNSELFHHPTCKSVKRINTENIATFTSIEHAMNEGFKPCRACCHIGMASQSVMGGFGYQRVSAI